jgi:drug/metabolite transporter (DMT)-like permease
MSEKPPSFSVGVVYILLSATGLAFVGLLGKLGEESLSLASLIFFRFLTAFLICFLWLWAAGYLKEGFKFGNPKLHLVRTFFVLVSQYCFFYYVQNNTLLNATVLLNTGPLFIPLIEHGILRNRVGRSTWVGVIVSFMGVICILQPDAGIITLASAVGLLAGISQGASQVVFGISSKMEKSELSVLYLLFLCACFSFIPYVFSLFVSNPMGHVKGANLLIIVLLGLASVLNQSFRAEAYRHSSPSRLSVFLYFSVLLAGVMDWTIFGKTPNFLSIIGACLIVLGGVLKIYLRRNVSQAPNK